MQGGEDFCWHFILVFGIVSEGVFDVVWLFGVCEGRSYIVVLALYVVMLWNLP